MAKKNSSNGSFFRNNRLVFAVILVCMALVFIGTSLLLGNIYQTKTYYVLKQDVPAKTQVTSEMLKAMTISSGSLPPTALSLADVQSGYEYTKFPLQAGDIITNSNVGAFEDIALGVPDSWVVTSFSVTADNAIGGRIHRGDYFDMMVVTTDGSFYPFVNILCLDTTVSLNNATSSNAADTAEAHSGQTSQYVVGVSPQDAATLQQIVKKYDTIKLVLSPRQNQYNPPQLSSYNGTFTYDGSTKDLGKGTDYTFTPVKRDAFGRPVDTATNCSKGNGKVDPKNCGDAPQNPSTPAANTSTGSTTLPTPTSNKTTSSTSAATPTATDTANK